MKKEILACSLCKGNCWNCFHADECDEWLDNGGNYIPTVTVESETASMALCEARHEIPDATDGAVFENSINPLDVTGLEEEATRKLEELKIKQLNLYVTGLTVALVSVLNAARKLEISVVLYHYDRETGSYYSQEVK